MIARQRFAGLSTDCPERVVRTLRHPTGGPFCRRLSIADRTARPINSGAKLRKNVFFNSLGIVRSPRRGWGVGQKSGWASLTDRQGSNAQIFFLQPQLLKSIKRNQINQTLGFKGAARFQVDEIADLFSGGGGGSKGWRTKRADPRTQKSEIKCKKPTPGWVKTLDPFDWDRRAARICSGISENFFSAPQPHTHRFGKLPQNSGGGGG
jgi:hypothetical protein